MINQTVLVGRLTKDPDLTYTPTGIATTKFTLAVNRAFKSQNSEQEADFINIVVWRKAAESAANYLKKGSLAGITGRIQTRNYEGQDGKKVYVTEVIAESVQFLDSKRDSNQENTQQNNSYSSNQQQTNNDQSYNDPFSSNSAFEITDDSLPF